MSEAVDPRIAALLADAPRWTTAKQRLTATRLHQLLRAEGYAVGVTVVKEAVAEWKRQQREPLIPLTYRGGELAQVDFFEVVVDIAGTRRKAWLFLLRLMYSGRDFGWIYVRQDQISLLNALAATIPATDRIVLIEETSEILIDKPNLVRFEARRAQAPLGQEVPLPAVTISDLLRATLRHQPDRILVGEVRGAEAFDLLQGLNTGHLGSLSTIHANSAEQALTRLAHCVLTANVGLPHRSTRGAIAPAIHLVVHTARQGGQRVVPKRGHFAGTTRIRIGSSWSHGP